MTTVYTDNKICRHSLDDTVCIFFDRNQLATHSSSFLEKLGGGLKTTLFAGSRSGSKWRINSGACCCLRLAFSTAMVLISAMILTIVLLASSRSNRKKSRFFLP